MKILVISDSHGDSAAIIRALKRCEHHVDMCVFLGDGADDAEYALELFPHLPRVIVRGNCDEFRRAASGFPDEAVFEADGITFYATHGHRHGVKSGIGAAASYASKRGASVLLYGHTHRKDESRIVSENATVTAINPGSIGRGIERTFAMVETVGENVVVGFAEV